MSGQPPSPRGPDEAAVREVMRLVLGESVPGSGAVVRAETDGWDSLKHVELVFALEDEFDVSLGESSLADLDSLESIQRELVRAAGG